MLKLLHFRGLKSDKKIIDILSHLFFLLLFILAFFYREERLISDASYYFFRVVNNESFWVEHDRYILILSQVAPWIGSNLGLELSNVVLISSLGHVFFFYSIYLISRYVFREVYAGLILLSIQLLGITSGFFVPMFEFYYAMGLLVLFNVVFKKSKHPLRHLVLIVLAFFIITAHFYAILLLIYSLLFHAFENKDFKLKKYVPYAILIALFMLLKPLVISSYEKEKTSYFLYSLSHNTYDFNYLKLWLNYIYTHYWDWALLVFLIISTMLYKKKYLLFTGFLVSLLGLIVMVNVSDYGFDVSRYKEQVNFSLMFITGFTFVYCLSILSPSVYKYSLLAIVSLVFIFRLYSIKEEGRQFTDRLDEMKQIMNKAQETEGTKFVINSEELKYDPNWSYPVESLIFSAIHNKKCVSIVTEDDYYFEENNEKIKPSQYLFRRWEVYGLTRLNERYFGLDDSEYIEFHGW